jgi:hypothetical protein
MEDPNTSRTAGLVLDVVTRFLSTSGSTGRVVNVLTSSLLISEQFRMILNLCWTVDGRKNRGFIESYSETVRGKVEDIFFRSLPLFYSPGIPETVNHKGRKVI